MVKEILAKTILNKHKRRDEWFLDDYSVNPYQLCEFNCVYCYIRGSKYGKNMTQGLAAKINAPELLEKALKRRAKKHEYGFIALGSSTEPWMYIEKKYEITRKCLEVILKFRFPVHCSTKSTLISRDFDLLKSIDQHAILPEDLRSKINHGALITFSFSTLDPKVAEIFEPNAPKPKERLETLQRAKDEGFFAGIAYMPILPFISDSYQQLEEMIKVAKELHVDYVFFSPLTLYGIGKEIYFRILMNYFPGTVEKYRKIFGDKWYPKKTYTNPFFKKVYALCRKYGVKIGITDIKLRL